MFATTLGVAALLPSRADAFWFSIANARAAPGSVVPDSGTPALQAATNRDPNPNKGIGDTLQTSGGKALVAFAGPSGTIADVASSTPSDRISVYVVRPGDTIGEIADMFGVSVNTIIWANNLKSSKDVQPGDTLLILPISGIERTVIKGDTLKSLAAKFGGDPDEIAQYNGIDPSEPLEIGSTIIIPGGELGETSPTQTQKQGTSGLIRSVGRFIGGYFSNPIPGGILTQGVHGWNAVDIGAARGTPVHATADGTVIVVRNNNGWNGAYGNYVVISHPNGTQSLYSHLRSAAVSSGQSVSTGEIIGYVGMTGRTTGPHLHFEVRGAANPFRNCSIGRVCSPQ